ncbi:uncharacterized protein LOC106093750 [Stomoxys calcitrans]|uniref:uncharacterized protein LOC106093750 n=1 Tax=Stomoxys calcitrans TaxID=35570 RepID=UPI0027E34E8E|nr:uncharacterized protein LOC106093750 [Stomoxys calcitrans]
MDCTNCSPTESTSPKTTVPTTLLREKVREYTKRHREQIRADVSDSLRFQLGEIKARIKELENLSEKDVAGLAARIKRRKHATEEDMYRLSHAFLQDAKNIETFSKITGALQVLVKELTGNDAERQLSAAECICNLSLGESPVCEKIAAAAGSYMVTYFHSKESQLVRLCLWTIANILATGEKASLTVMRMKLLPQLWKMYCDEEIVGVDLDYRMDTAVCLQLIALNAENLLTEEDRHFLFEHVTDKNPNSVAGEFHLQIVFLTLFPNPQMVATLDAGAMQYLLNYSLININNTNDFSTESQRLKLFYAVRILCNLLVLQPLLYSTLLLQISCVWKSDIIGLLNKLFAFHNADLTDESLWLMKNLLRLEKEYKLMSPDLNLLDNIHIFENSTPILENVEDDAMSIIVSP